MPCINTYYMTNSVRNNSVNMTLHVGVHLYRVFKHSCVLDFLQLIPNDANPVAAEDTAGVPTVEYPPWNICFVMYIMTYMYYTFLSFLLFLYRRTYEISFCHVQNIIVVHIIPFCQVFTCHLLLDC